MSTFWQLDERRMPAAGGIVAQILDPNVREILLEAQQSQVQLSAHICGPHVVLFDQFKDLLYVPARLLSKALLEQITAHLAPPPVYKVAGHNSATRVWLEWGSAAWEDRLNDRTSGEIGTSLTLARRMFASQKYAAAQAAALGCVFSLSQADFAETNPSDLSHLPGVLARLPPIGSVVLEAEVAQLSPAIGHAAVLCWVSDLDRQTAEVFWIQDPANTYCPVFGCQLSGRSYLIKQECLGLLKVVADRLAAQPVDSTGESQIDPAVSAYPFQTVPYCLSNNYRVRQEPESRQVSVVIDGPGTVYEKLMHRGHRKGPGCLDEQGQWDPQRHPMITVIRHKKTTVNEQAGSSADICESAEPSVTHPA